MPKGYPVVLTADRTLMAAYDLLFDGMVAASETSTAPPALLANLLMPRPRALDGRVLTAPLGLRRIEAALLAGGFTADEVTVADEAHLDTAIGSDTRIAAVSVGEPGGRGMNSTTMTAISGGHSYPQVMCHRMLRAVRRRLPVGAKIVAGGPGAWQLAGDADLRAELGIDHVVTGYAEGNAAEIIRALVNGVSLPVIIPGVDVSAEAIPAIRGATTMGAVEISRGCGLGCMFCTLARVPMRHLPVETIATDVAINVATGNTSVALLSEDFFRYGADGVTANPAALLALLERLRRTLGLRLIQTDHANVCSIAQFTDDELSAVRAAMVGAMPHDFPWVNVGVETASGRLLRANGGGPKMGRVSPETWRTHCAEQLRRLCRAGFFPLASLVMGLPGEEEEDVQRTLEWVESLHGERLAIFPVLFAPIDGSAMGPDVLTPLHWKLIRACYTFNFRWMPALYWDNQTAAGASLARRLSIRGLAPLKTLQWKALFAWHAWRAE